MEITELLSNKKILIWGYGREGKSTEDFLKAYYPTASIEIFEGKRDEINDDAYDYIVKSPGIRMDEDNPKFISQTELFLLEFKDKVIGVTGTKGKSTTSSMLAHVLSDCLPDKNVILLGNIGLPCLDYYGQIDDDTIVVFEMSCHQLAHVDVSPHIAVFLNLYEEHLDYYDTLERYFAAKANIARYQTESDLFYVGSNVPAIDTKAKLKVMDNLKSDSFELFILGEHNQYNAQYVYTIASENFDISDDSIRNSLKTFKGLPHRLQYVTTLDDIDYYDDSISTIPNATIQALSSIENSQTVLIGGMDRGIDYTALVEFIKIHPEYNYICAYESGKRIYDQVKDCTGTYYANDLLESVKLAKKITKKGKAIVLSPASASYGYFKNFEHRGEMFCEYLKESL